MRQVIAIAVLVLGGCSKNTAPGGPGIDGGQATFDGGGSADGGGGSTDGGGGAIDSAVIPDANTQVDSSLSCTSPMADCDFDPSNGCEIDTSNDPLNCGTCGYSCNGGTCSNSGCSLVTGGTVTYTFNDFSVIAVDSTNVYFSAVNVSSNGPSGLLSVPRAGGSVTVLAGGATVAAGVAVYGNFVYWVDHTVGAIYETPVPGQAGSTRSVVTGLTSPVMVAVDAANVYWTSAAGVGAADKATGTALWPITNQAGGSPWGITIDQADIFYADPSANAIVEVPIATGVATVIAPSQTKARNIVSTATDLAWTLPPSGDIVETTKASPVSSPAFLSGLTSPWALAFDGSELYWSQDSSTAGNISKALVGPSPVVHVVAPNETSPQSLAIVGGEVYWMNHGGAQLLKAKK